MSELVHIPFHDGEVLAVEVDGRPHVVLRPAIEALGLAYQPQHRKLASKSWACVTTVVTQMPGDDQRREVAVVDIRTFLMLLATIDERRVSEAARPLLIAYQSEVADVIEAYFTRGGAVNPRASEEQLQDLTSIAERQMRVINLAKGLVSADYLAVKARLVLARVMGELPEVNASEMPLYVEAYLREKGLKKAEIIGLRSVFGKRVARAYFDRHGHRPAKAPGEVGSRVHEINAYFERDRPLLDEVWEKHFAAGFGKDLFGGVA